MAGILVVRTNTKLTYEDLIEYQQSLVRMMRDGVVVIPPGYEISYFSTEEDDDADVKVGFE